MSNPIKGDSNISNGAGVPGVLGTSTSFNGVLGYTTAEGHAGVAGACDEGLGNGLYGRSKNRIGVVAISEFYEALHAETNSSKTAAIAAYNNNSDSEMAALYAKKKGVKGCSAVFDGKVIIVEGDLKITKGTLLIKGVNIFDWINQLVSQSAQLQSEINMLNASVSVLQAKIR